ncbi:MAG: hypothetical protein SFY56_15610 [Bacteroidota bacterium]|nr:hypothetical protein [Bacteroidota bacterium]
MKKLVIISAIASLFFSACKTSQLTSFNDDAYTNPAEEKRMAKLAAEEQAKKDAENKQKMEQERLAQKAKDDANPLYKDPVYNSDDYYDYQYASRVRRFNQSINGAGYYDNYYTNQYYYNQNPSCYGTSIYSTYNYMPSNQFSYCGSGLSFGGCNTGYSPYGYNPYGYNNYYGNNYYNTYGGYYGNNNGYYPYGYNNYYGYNFGTINNYYGNNYNNNGWGYLNGYDPNSNYASMYNGPRGSNGGNNGGRSSSAGMAVPEDLQYKARNEFFQSVVQKQESTPRFTEVVKPGKSSINEENVNTFFNATTGQNNTNPTRNTTSQNENLNNNTASQPNSTDSPKKGGFLSGFFNNNSGTSTVNEPINSTPRSNSGTKVGASGIENSGNSNTNSSQKTSNSGWNNSGSGNGTGNSGGSSSPRSTGGSNGGGRPR